MSTDEEKKPYDPNRNNPFSQNQMAHGLEEYTSLDESDHKYKWPVSTSPVVSKKQNTQGTPENMKLSETSYLNNLSSPLNSISTNAADEYYDMSITGSTIKNTPTRETNLKGFDNISPISELNTPYSGLNTPYSNTSRSTYDVKTPSSLSELFDHKSSDESGAQANDYNTTNEENLSLMTNTDTSLDDSTHTKGGYKSRNRRYTKKRRSQKKKKKSSQKKKKQLRKRTKKYNKK